jgi:hypothetical protein
LSCSDKGSSGRKSPSSNIASACWITISFYRDELGSAWEAGSEMTGISINDLRKNLRDLNEYMDKECRSAPARYGVILDASLITGIDPPPEVESALAAINTAHNQVSSDISLAQAAADQRVVQSRRAVEIETLKRAGRSGAGQIARRRTGRASPQRAQYPRRLSAQCAPGALR